MDMRKAGLPECARVFTALWHGKIIQQHTEKSRDKDGEMLGSLTRHKNIFWPIDRRHITGFPFPMGPGCMLLEVKIRMPY